MEVYAVSLILALDCHEVSNFAPDATYHDTMPHHRFRWRQASLLPLCLLLHELKKIASK